MRKIILLFALITLFSCNTNKLEGVYTYQETETKKPTNFFDLAGAAEMGRQMGCEMIGQFEFKNGNCYFNVMGAEQRVEYEIEDNMIYLGSNSITKNGIGLKIIDENTIEYMGCNFIKNTKDLAENNKTTQSSSEKETEINLDLENKSNQSALIKNIYSKNNNIYFDLDFVDLEYVETDTKIINNNPKIRTFKLSSETNIEDCLKNKQINKSNILEYKNEILEDKDYVVIFDVENGEVKSINLGCYN